MSYEQAVVSLQETNAELVKAVNRVRDAAMGMNRMYSSTSAGVAAVLDGEYFVVPGGGVYQRLYQRSGGSATLIAEYPDASEVVLQSEIGTAASRDVTTSSTDTTAGRLMKVGDFGVGEGLRLDGADLNTLFEMGFYFVNDLSTNKPTNMGGSVLVFGGGAQPYLNQLFVPRQSGDGTVYTRAKDPSSSVWGEWTKHYNQNNILGTVSQSSGVPTGAVIERGSNANGEYTKFADGTLICAGFYPENGVAINQASGGVYKTAGVRTVTYPSTFFAPPRCSLNIRRRNNGWDIFYSFVTAGTSTFDFFPVRLQVNASNDYTLDYIAIGRWV